MSNQPELVDVERIREINRELFEMDHRADFLRRDRAKLVDRLLTGMSLQDVATLVGVTRQRVHQWHNQR